VYGEETSITEEFVDAVVVTGVIEVVVEVVLLLLAETVGTVLYVGDEILLADESTA